MKASHRILTNSIIQIFIFGILSIIYWNKSGGDIGLIFGGVIFWIIHIENTIISITKVNEDDFICLTDMAKAKQGDNRAADIIKNWLRSRTTIEFLGTWWLIRF